jgi:hypothetical protein
MGNSGSCVQGREGHSRSESLADFPVASCEQVKRFDTSVSNGRSTVKLQSIQSPKWVVVESGQKMSHLERMTLRVAIEMLWSARCGLLRATFDDFLHFDPKAGWPFEHCPVQCMGRDPRIGLIQSIWLESQGGMKYDVQCANEAQWVETVDCGICGCFWNRDGRGLWD